MAQEDVSQVSAIQQANMAARAQQSATNRAVRAEAANESLQQWGELAAFNPLVLTKRFQTLEERLGRKAKGKEAEQAEKEGQASPVQVQKVEESAESHQRKNPELNKHVLLLLKSRITPEDTKEEIAKKVLDLFPDPYLADEALDFLLETTEEGDLAKRMHSVKEDLNLLYGREIRSGKNMGSVSRKYAMQGLGDANTLRELYREVTGNPKEPAVLFEEFSSHFDFDRLQPLIGFLLHSLGSDLKSKGPSIPKAELQRLFSEARTMQAILGVYRFFRGRMGPMKRALSLKGFMLPDTLNFELLSKLFVKFLQERYPNTAKLLQFSGTMGISEEIAAQLVIYAHMKEGLRQTAPKLFRNEKHRHDLISVYLDALEELEDALEEEEEEEEEEKKKGDE